MGKIGRSGSGIRKAISRRPTSRLLFLVFLCFNCLLKATVNPDNSHVPVLYPISILEHWLPLQYPKTPKSTPEYVPSGMPLMMGVEMTEMSRRTNAAKSSIDRGVAGLNIVANWLSQSSRVQSEDEFRTRPMPAPKGTQALGWRGAATQRATVRESAAKVEGGRPSHASRARVEEGI